MLFKDGVRASRGAAERTAAPVTEEHREVESRVDRATRLQRSVGNRATVRAFGRARDVVTVLPADHPDERAADRLAADALAERPARAPAPLSTAPSRGGGRPLAPGLRREMEGAFGAGFGGVRVHDDARADGLSRSIGALAFTSGPDIYFRGGAHAPGSPGGRRLIAHELAHVVQQARRPAATPVIQRYTRVASEHDGGPVTWSEDNTFIRQVSGDLDFLADVGAEDARLAEHSGEEGVTLKVSENYQLAVEALDEGNQAKAYYSTQEQLTETNDKLDEASSSFRMVAQEGQSVTLTRPDQGAVTLEKVFPRNIATPKTNVRSPGPDETEVTEGLAMRSRQQCVELAEAVMGRTIDASKEATLKLGDDISEDFEALGALLMDVGLVGTGEMNTSNLRGALDNFFLAIEEIAASNSAAEAVVAEITPLFRELQGCMLRDTAPSLALSTMLVACVEAEQYKEIPQLAKIEALASTEQLVGLPGLLRDAHKAARQFAVWREIKRVRASEDSDDAAQELGIDGFARPEIGEAYKITYLQRETGDWNFHWAGVVARDGDDSVTLENYTREFRAPESRFHDARWYFDMYGVEDQSFHEVYRRLGHGEAMTTVYGSKARGPAKEPAPMGASVGLSREFAGRLAVIRRQLMQDSGDRHNEHYLDIVRLLSECATLAIDAAEAPEAYKTLVERADEISVAYDKARSKKWFAQDARNAALEAMWRELVTLKKEAFRVFLNLGG